MKNQNFDINLATKDAVDTTRFITAFAEGYGRYLFTDKYCCQNDGDCIRCIMHIMVHCQNETFIVMTKQQNEWTLGIFPFLVKID